MPAWIPNFFFPNGNRSAAVIKLPLIGAELAAAAYAHDPITTNVTWSKEISRVMRLWAKAIRDEVLNRQVPPWDAVQGVGDFRDDRSLSTARDGSAGELGGGRRAGGRSDLSAANAARDRRGEWSHWESSSGTW
jgi:hypothetical protein